MPKRTISELATAAGLSPEAQKRAGDGSDVRTFAEALSHALPEDAVRFLAYLLPSRQGVLWAWSCAKRSVAEVSPQERESLLATEKWLAEATDESRRAAMSAAQGAPLGTPAGAAGFAAFLCGPSLAPPEAPPVPAGEHLAMKAITASIMLSAVLRDPEKAPEKYRDFLMRGFELAQRTRLWENPRWETTAALPRTE